MRSTAGTIRTRTTIIAAIIRVYGIPSEVSVDVVVEVVDDVVDVVEVVDVVVDDTLTGSTRSVTYDILLLDAARYSWYGPPISILDVILDGIVIVSSLEFIGDASPLVKILPSIVKLTSGLIDFVRVPFGPVTVSKPPSHVTVTPVGMVTGCFPNRLIRLPNDEELFSSYILCFSFLICEDTSRCRK